MLPYLSDSDNESDKTIIEADDIEIEDETIGPVKFETDKEVLDEYVYWIVKDTNMRDVFRHVYEISKNDLNEKDIEYLKTALRSRTQETYKYQILDNFFGK